MILRSSGSWDCNWSSLHAARQSSTHYCLVTLCVQGAGAALNAFRLLLSVGKPVPAGGAPISAARKE